MMQQLAKLAIMSGRVPVWPTVDCSVSYADGRNQSFLQSEPPEVPQSWIPYWSHSWKKVHCYFMPLFEPGMYESKRWIDIFLGYVRGCGNWIWTVTGIPKIIICLIQVATSMNVA